MKQESNMSFILIPQIVSSTTAMIWVGAIDENVRTAEITLLYIESDKFDGEENLLSNPSLMKYKLEESEWRTWKTRHVLDRSISKRSDIKILHYQRITLGLGGEFLEPRTCYEVRLLVKTKTKDGAFNEKIINNCQAQVTTLPKSLPKETDNEKSFKVMLGSCFYRLNDLDGMVGKTFDSLKKRDAQPEIKFLCGDQVYLDNPWRETTFNLIRPFLPPERMRSYFFDKYIANWTQLGTDAGNDWCGFNLLLRNGANYFCSDDHEYWNNAPDWGFVGMSNTLFRGQRRWWFREASELFRVFQSLAPWMTFDVSPLSFCIVDSRINRLPHRRQFMEDEDLKAIGRWIEGLQGPGVLVMGQVLMSEETPWYQRFADLTLADYREQYRELKGYIENSNHSIVFLTGDVHFGRVSVCDLNKKKGTKFVEVVSSPMMVVGDWRNRAKVNDVVKAPETFSHPVDCYAIAAGEDHFVTLEFLLTDTSQVKMKINTWEILKTEPDDNVKRVKIKRKSPDEVKRKIPKDCKIPDAPIEITL